MNNMPRILIPLRFKGLRSHYAFALAIFFLCATEACFRSFASCAFRYVGACVFHGFLPPSPPECCHVIHGNVATQSRGFLPSIPRECCHPVSGMPVTLGASRRWIV